MSTPAEKPLVDMDRKELLSLLRTLAGNDKYLVYHYNDVRLELERRRVERWARLSFLLSFVAIVISVVSLLTKLR